MNHLQGCMLTSNRRRAAAFTLIDLLVSIAVIVMLIAIMLPKLEHVRESTRRLVCLSNLRQHGLGVLMFSDDNKGKYPVSVFEAPERPVPGSVPQAHKMNYARVDTTNAPTWDGLGVLYARGYISAPQIYYCPSHTAGNTFQANMADWRAASQSVNAGGDAAKGGKLLINFQYRGGGTLAAAAKSDAGTARRMVMLTDGLRTKAEFNHKTGTNVIRRDQSASWFSDPGKRILFLLPDEKASERQASDKVTKVWTTLDENERLPSPTATTPVASK